jgi:hypothetical protein
MPKNRRGKIPLGEKIFICAAYRFCFAAAV